MTLVCIRPFGHFVPGDKVTVPKDAVFDTAYFETAEDNDDEKDGEQ